MPRDDETQFGTIVRKLDSLQKEVSLLEAKVDGIRAALFGVEGQGGLHKWVQDINARLLRMEADYQLSKGKVLGLAISVSALISLISAVVSLLLK